MAAAARIPGCGLPAHDRIFPGDDTTMTVYGITRFNRRTPRQRENKKTKKPTGCAPWALRVAQDCRANAYFTFPAPLADRNNVS
jgi:hypothetical protein